MPGMDGRQVLETAAAYDTLAIRHACVVITANSHLLAHPLTGLLTQLSALVLAKPFDLDALLATIDAAAARVAGR